MLECKGFLSTTIDENEDFNPKLKHLVEETFHNGKDQRVVLLGHSMGALYALSFLKNQSDAWKRQYIKAFVAVSAPLGGSIKALKMEASGDNFGIYFDNPLWYRDVQRSMSSLAFLLPDPRLWSKDEVVIYTPAKNYTVHDYKEFFFDIGFPEEPTNLLNPALILDALLMEQDCLGRSIDGRIGDSIFHYMYEDAKLTVDALTPPTGVNEVYCIYSSAVRTPGTLIYSSTFPDAQPDVVYETDGDGTVNVRSLSVCKSWANNSGGVDQVETLVIPGVNHLSIILDSRLINRAKEISNAEQPMPVENNPDVKLDGVKISKTSQQPMSKIENDLLVDDKHTSGEKTSEPQFFVANDTTELSGSAFFFLRASERDITPANIVEEVFFHFHNAQKGDFIETTQHLLKVVYLPAIQSNQNWGCLERYPEQKTQLLNEFVDTTWRYLRLLKQIQEGSGLHFLSAPSKEDEALIASLKRSKDFKGSK
ncbi:Group XV phospholipase A2 [Echinococcus granulosus]|uniref:Group XV phospholipase A2 n=1 Tax=Echinococcus granulosus TaxID=6210 RepID=W6UBZ3_ECHGR|nr:Group XV phospholipase A2 [Echinococcus granulosus]EUB55932.1 Group XV phospholipase A2 [Echinococcus granulosus]